jgi:uncharacterized protein (TIGR03643 family)
MKSKSLTDIELNKLIDFAWDDNVSFDNIKCEFNLNEDEVKKIMKSNLKRKSYQNWRQRVSKIKNNKKLTK